MSATDVDVAVVGSGFGASIAAWRLAGQGQRVLVMERGRRYAPGEFPRDLRDTRKIFWVDGDPAAGTGLYDVRFHSGIGTITASGVGGGSLIYANNLVRPAAEVFDAWPEPFRGDRLDPLFAQIESKLSASPIPPIYRLPKRRALHDAARFLERPVFDTPQAVSWMHPANPGQGHCVLCAECEFGCNHGAKNTLDFTFLREAFAAGAKLSTSCQVSHVEALLGDGLGGQNGYRVHYRDLATGSDKSVSAQRVVLGAGALGSTEILLKSRDQFETLPKLSPRLGYGFSSNGDFLATLQNSTVVLDPWYGPDVTSVITFEDRSGLFTLAAPSFNQATMTYLASLGQGREHHASWLTDHAWPHLALALRGAFATGLLGKPIGLPLPGAGPADRMTCLFALGRDNANGRMVLKSGKLDVTWDYANENRALIDAMRAAMHRVGEFYGGTVAPLATWDLFEKTVTVHPLGGCCMAESPKDGVVDCSGQVFGYPGLYVCDAAVIPAAIGFHPALTISAVAMKFADDMVGAHA